MEFVGAASAVSSDGTLGDARDTILVVSALLTDTVEMNGGAVVLELVDEGDLDIVTPVGLDDRSWNLSVDGEG